MYTMQTLTLTTSSMSRFWSFFNLSLNSFIYVCACVPSEAGEGESDRLEPESPVVVNHLMWVLEAEPWSPARAASALNC